MEIQWCLRKWRWEKRSGDDVLSCHVKSNGLSRPYLCFSHLLCVSCISEEDFLGNPSDPLSFWPLRTWKSKMSYHWFCRHGPISMYIKMQSCFAVFLIEFLHESENNQWFVAHCLRAPETVGFSNFPSRTQFGSITSFGSSTTKCAVALELLLGEERSASKAVD